MEEKKKSNKWLLILLGILALVLGLSAGYFGRVLLLGKSQVDEEGFEKEANEEIVFSLNGDVMDDLPEGIPLDEFIMGDWKKMQAFFQDSKITSNYDIEKGEKYKIIDLPDHHIRVLTKPNGGIDQVYTIILYGPSEYSLMGLSYGLDAAVAKIVLDENAEEVVDFSASHQIIDSYTVRTAKEDYCVFIADHNCVTHVVLEHFYATDTAEELTKESVYVSPETVEVKESTAEDIEASYFKNVNLRLTGWGNKSKGVGYNSAGEAVNRVLFIDTEIGIDWMNKYELSIVSCSWDRVINGDGTKRILGSEHADFETQKKGGTYLERYTEVDKEGNLTRYGWMLFMPDDPSIEGTQTVTIEVGGEKKVIEIEIKYLGDYEDGAGWRLTRSVEKTD